MNSHLVDILLVDILLVDILLVDILLVDILLVDIWQWFNYFGNAVTWKVLQTSP